ncbi:hypothetical protein DPMN_157670 [Dreissena polymorpha]|uniref:Uncharacterized protein n=1 Tax=Dreissena polymorpha TaxID=45954 RepID=A0A9D4EGF2_DREPO|nr:hypothetical protein DPMN_157670 [Dreissena polymorpha]
MLHQQKEAVALAVEAEELRQICNTSNSAGSVSLQPPDEQEDKLNTVKNYIETHLSLCSKQMCTFKENNNICQFLLRNELILSRISNFNDCSDNYRAWKALLSRLVLLVKYLGTH